MSSWIEETLDSVHAQIRCADEVIVVDDSSTDDTVAKVTAHPLDCTILHCRHGNAAATRNVGIKHATGDWVAFLDGDDLWREDHLQLFASTIREHDVAYFAHHHGFYDNGETEERTPLQPASEGGLSDERLLSFFVAKNHGWPTSGMIVRRERLGETGGFDETQIRRHDAEMFMRAIKGHTWAYQSEPTWRYRLGRPGNISGNASSCSVYYLNALLKIEEMYPDPRLRDKINLEARNALSMCLKASNPDEWATAYRLGISRVNIPSRAFYGFAWYLPGLSRAVLNMKSSLTRRDLSKRKGG